MLGKRTLRNQKGFTLIEIIAVLVILGILAAVAVPKYMDLQSQARDKAVQGALAEGISTVSMAFAKLMLSSGSANTTALKDKATANKPASSDFDYTFAVNATGIVVTASPKAGGVVVGAASASKTWILP